MNLPEAVKTVLGKYADFSGRARRSEFWFWYLAVFATNVVLSVLEQASNLFVILAVLVALAVIVPTLAAGARRLHDTDRSAWWLLIALVPFVGAIVLIVFWAQDSTADNQYGPNPKAAKTVAPQYAA